MADTSTKPHTRQKMRLMTQKKLVCSECSTTSRRRHVLLCFHSFCEKCYGSLAKALMGTEEGVLCSICKTFEPYHQKEERDEGPPVFCKVHSNVRYLLNCVTCNQILCYKCKMGDHYYHQSETVQSALDRILPFVTKNPASNTENNNKIRQKVLENETEIKQVTKKIDKYETFLKDEYKRLETKIRADYKTVKMLEESKEERRRGIVDAQQEMLRYFQKIKLPFHGEEMCPDEGAIVMNNSEKVAGRCISGRCGGGGERRNSDDSDNEDEDYRREFGHSLENGVDGATMDTGGGDNICSNESCDNKVGDSGTINKSDCDMETNGNDGENNYTRITEKDSVDKNDVNLGINGETCCEKGCKNNDSNCAGRLDNNTDDRNNNVSGDKTNSGEGGNKIDENKTQGTNDVKNDDTKTDVSESSKLNGEDDDRKSLVKREQDKEDEKLCKIHKLLKEADPDTHLCEYHKHNPQSHKPESELCEHHKKKAKKHLHNGGTCSNPHHEQNLRLHDKIKTHSLCNHPEQSSNEHIAVKCNHHKHEANTKKSLAKRKKTPAELAEQEKNIVLFKRSCGEEGYKVLNVDKESSVATVEKNGKTSTISLLCDCCENKKTASEAIDYTEVYTALKSSKEVEIGDNKIGDETLCVRFRPSNVEKTELFEKIDFDSAGNLIDKETGHIMVDNVLGTVEIVRKPYRHDKSHLEHLHTILIEKAYREKREKNEPLVETCSCYDEVKLKPGRDSLRNTNLNLMALPSKEFQYQGFFCYGSPKVCERLCRLGDRVYLPCHINEDKKYFIMRYHSFDGRLIKNARPPPGIETPHALYPFNEDQLLLASESGLHLLDKDLQLVCKLMKGSYSDVSFEGSRIAVLDDCRSHVKIIDISTNPPTFQSNFHVDNYTKGNSSLILRGDAVFITTSDHKIKKYSLSGDLIWQWGSYGDKDSGPGFLHQPRVCSVDDRESLLVVDAGNQRLQVVDSACEWRMLELAEVRHPGDALVTEDGMLYVLCKQKSVVHWYKFDV